MLLFPAMVFLCRVVARERDCVAASWFHRLHRRHRRDPFRRARSARVVVRDRRRVHERHRPRRARRPRRNPHRLDLAPRFHRLSRRAHHATRLDRALLLPVPPSVQRRRRGRSSTQQIDAFNTITPLLIVLAIVAL